jgi:alcohol dehydrogenase
MDETELLHGSDSLVRLPREKNGLTQGLHESPSAGEVHVPKNFWNFYSAGRLVFGRGAVSRLASLLPGPSDRAPRHLFLLSDRRLESAGVVSHVLQPLQQAGHRVTVCLDGEPEPTRALADVILQQARAAQPDVMVGVGGGSNLDLAKIVANLLTHGGRDQDYFGFGNVPGPILPMIALPTTAGTGSEVSHAAVLTDEQQHIKVSTLSHYLRPGVAVVDPALTDSCPAQPTADSGIDALTHAIEAFTATPFDQLEIGADEPFPYDGKQPMGDLCAERAISLIGRHLVTAVQSPSNTSARDGMALAATLAGLAFSNNAVAAVHALEYPLGGAVHVSHGAGNGLLLPHVMRFNRSVRLTELARIAELLGESVTGITTEAAADRAIDAVVRLQQQIGIPLQLRSLGVRREQLPEFASKAFGITRLMKLNARRPSEAELLAILEAAY